MSVVPGFPTQNVCNAKILSIDENFAIDENSVEVVFPIQWCVNLTFLYSHTAHGTYSIVFR